MSCIETLCGANGLFAPQGGVWEVLLASTLNLGSHQSYHCLHVIENLDGCLHVEEYNCIVLAVLEFLLLPLFLIGICLHVQTHGRGRGMYFSFLDYKIFVSSSSSSSSSSKRETGVGGTCSKLCSKSTKTKPCRR
jgi:hypothetical protein